jgi:hypothetical protein
LQKEKDLEEAEQRIKKLRDDLALMEESFEVVAKRSFMKGERDSPEMHAEKKVKIEEVQENLLAVKMGESSDNSQAVKMGESSDNSQAVKMDESQAIKKRSSSRALEDATTMAVRRDKKTIDLQSSGSKLESKTQEILELDSNGDIVSSGKNEVVEKPSRSRADYKLDKSDFRGLVLRADSPPRKTLLGEGGL